MEKAFIKGLKFHFVQTMDEVIAAALLPNKIKGGIDFSRFSVKDGIAAKN